MSFLPGDLALQLPPAVQNGEQIITCLERRLGRSALRQSLISHLFEIGTAGVSIARQRFCSHGLDYRRRGPLGLALQSLLEQADELVQSNDWARAIGRVRIADGWCRFEICQPGSWSRIREY